MGSPLSPLSIHYQPEYPINHGWAEKSLCMADFLLSLEADEKWMESQTRFVDSTLLSFFVDDEPFREALLAEAQQPLDRDALQMESLIPEIADLYYERLSLFRTTALQIINATPQDFLQAFLNALQEDQALSEMQRQVMGGRACKVVKQLSLFSKHKEELSQIFLNFYNEGTLYATASTGRANLITPVTFIGFSGKYSVDQSFSLCPETFDGGYIVLKCDMWGEEWGEPELVEASCSGVKQIAVKNDTIILAIDHSKKKPSILFGKTEMPASQAGQYVVTICEAGEFLLEIFYRKDLNAPESEDIPLFVYEFCCK